MTPVAAKKSRSANRGAVIDPRLKGLFAWIAGPGRTVVMAVVIVAAFVAGAFLLWGKLSEEILSSDEYWVTPDRVDISGASLDVERPFRQIETEITKTLTRYREVTTDAAKERHADRLAGLGVASPDSAIRFEEQSVVYRNSG